MPISKPVDSPGDKASYESEEKETHESVIVTDKYNPVSNGKFLDYRLCGVSQILPLSFQLHFGKLIRGEFRTETLPIENLPVNLPNELTHAHVANILTQVLNFDGFVGPLLAKVRAFLSRICFFYPRHRGENQVLSKEFRCDFIGLIAVMLKFSGFTFPGHLGADNDRKVCQIAAKTQQVLCGPMPEEEAKVSRPISFPRIDKTGPIKCIGTGKDAREEAKQKEKTNEEEITVFSPIKKVSLAAQQPPILQRIINAAKSWIKTAVTPMYLLRMGAKPWRSKKKRRLKENSCQVRSGGEGKFRLPKKKKKFKKSSCQRSSCNVSGHETCDHDQRKMENVAKNFVYPRNQRKKMLGVRYRIDMNDHMDWVTRIIILIYNKKLINISNVNVETMDITSKKTGGARETARKLISWIGMNPD